MLSWVEGENRFITLGPGKGHTFNIQVEVVECAVTNNRSDQGFAIRVV